jgi:hypothetical protein
VEKNGLIWGRRNKIGLTAEQYGRWHYVTTVIQGRCSGRNTQVNVGKRDRTRKEVKRVRTKIIKNVHGVKSIEVTLMN